MALGPNKIARTWVREGGNPKYAGLMAQIALRESGGHVKINNAGTNSNGTTDWGLYQVNDVWRKDPVVGKLFRSGKILTRRGATKAAIRILNVQGPQAWATYHAATDDKYLGGFKGTVKAGRPAAPGAHYKLRAGTPGTVKVDTDGAIVDSLLEHHKTGLLQSAVSKVESGAYTTTTPGRDPKLVKKYGVAGPAAGDPHSHVDTGQKGTANFEGHTVAAWIAPALRYARAHGWEGTVSSGFRSFAEQKRIYDSGVRPAAVPGTSNHEGTQFPRGAVDVTAAPALSAILLKSPYAKKLIYAGGKDPVHFSHPHDGSY